MELYMILKTEDRVIGEGTIIGPLDSVCVIDGEISAGRGHEDIELSLRNILYKGRSYDEVHILDRKEIVKNYPQLELRLE